MSELVTTSLVPAIVGLVWVAATAGLPKKDQPVLAVVLGIALQCLVAYKTTVTPDWANMVLVGIGTGLSAAGFQTASTRTTQYAKTATRKVRAAVSRRPTVTFASPVNVARAPEPPAPAL